MTETIGRYELLGRLAMGGMAEILLARLLGPSGFERPVVVKRVLPHLAEQFSFVQMFLNEARLAAQIHQRNVVQVHELGQDDKNLYLVMEYLEGENVAGIIRRTIVAGRALDPVLSAYVVAEACAGLHAAHELTDAAGRPLGLVHRDVSPQNIFVTYQGVVKVLDFGIAKAADSTTHTEAGQLKGKFDYMSPEQSRGRTIDRRSDIYALGIVLYEMLTRKRLYKRESKLATLEAIWNDPIVPPSKIAACPPKIEQVAMKALMKAPEERYQTAAEMRRDLMLAVRELSPVALPEETLSALMTDIFGDRITEKRDLLRRVRTGASVAEVPVAEVDSGVEIPELEQPTPSKIRERRDATADASAATRPRTGRKLLLALTLLLLIAAGVGATLLWIRQQPSPPALRAVAANLPRPEPIAEATKAPPPTPEPAPATVVIDVSSTPDGASVFIGDEERGKTPLSLELPKADQPIELRIAKPGYRERTERVTPDVNQRLRVMLAAARGGAIRKSGGKSAGNDGFRRFD